MTTKIWENREYHIAPSRVRCGADRDGCQVFEITGKMGTLKVLALDESEAQLAYKEDLENDPEWCSECRRYGYGSCICNPDDLD